MVKVTFKCDKCGKEETFEAKHADICNYEGLIPIVLKPNAESIENSEHQANEWVTVSKPGYCHDGMRDCEDWCPECYAIEFAEYAEEHPELFGPDY